MSPTISSMMEVDNLRPSTSMYAGKSLKNNKVVQCHSFVQLMNHKCPLMFNHSTALRFSSDDFPVYALYLYNSSSHLS